MKATYKALFLALILLLTHFAHAYDPIRGGIAIEEKGPKLLSPPASDLYNDQEQRVYLEQEVIELYETSDGQIDLSRVQPDPTTNVWSPEEVKLSAKEMVEQIDDKIELKPFLDEVRYVGSLDNVKGTHRFSVEKDIDMGFGFKIPKNFNIFAGRTAHNVLLRRNLLRKIGYKVPAIKWIEKIKVHFKDKDEKQKFFDEFSNNTPLTDYHQWIAVEKDDMVILQDVIVTEPIEPIYNFALGYMEESVPKNRRLINSLIIPFNLVDIPESINQYQWIAGRVYSENIFLPGEYSTAFSATWHDARWMARKILSLTEADLEDIVKNASLPPTIQVIVLEKLKSRRNSLITLFRLDAIEYKVPAMNEINNGECLIDAKVVCEDWEGYGTRFAYGDPESPLSSSELSAYLGSKAVSTVIDSVIAGFNKIPYFGTDINGNNSRIIQEHVDTVLADAQASGTQVTELPLKTWSFPIAQGNLIFSRNVIAGSFLGTDHALQLVDTVGFSVSAGVYAGMVGLPGAINQYSVAGAAVTGSLVRTYAHIKPITAIKGAMKPWKNAFVPALKRRYGKYFEELVSDEFNNLSQEEQQAKIKNALSLFKDNLEIGESLLITDALAANIAGQLNINYKLVSAQLGLNPAWNVVSRLHIVRSGENTIQIYKDFGNVGSFQISLGLSAGVPILRASVKFAKGTAKTKYFSVDISENNPKVITNVTALKSVLMSGSLRKLKAEQKPFVIKHKFSETHSRFGIFTLRLNKIKSQTSFSIQHPQGDVKNFYRQYDGRSRGNDYQAYLNELIGYYTGKLLNFEFQLSGLGGGNPGNSFMGTAKNRIATFESEVAPGGKLKNYLVKVTELWNGWKLKHKKAVRLLKKIKKKFRFEFFNDQVLHNTNNLFLYNINVNFHFYPEGIEHMLGLTSNEIKAIFKKYNSTFDPGSREGKNIFVGSGIKRFMKYRKKYNKHMNSNKYKKISKYITKMLMMAQKKLTHEGLEQLMGSKENFFIQGKIDGFRDGNEDTTNNFNYYENPYVSNTLGEIGADGMDSLRGPLAPYIKKMGISTGELYIQWLMGRVY